MITIPNKQTKKINQNNRSKILGDIWSSFNLDLQSSLGLVRVSPRLQLNTGGVTNQGISTAFKDFDQRIFTLAGTRIFKNTGVNLTSQFVEDASTGALTTFNSIYSDMETFNLTLCASATDKLVSKATNGSGGGSWTSRATFGAGDSSHKLCYFSKTNRLYYVDNYSSIKSIDISWSEATSAPYFLDLSKMYNLGQIQTMESDATDIWIGTVQVVPAGVVNAVGHASIFRWDGISAQITTEYKVKAKGILALCKDDRNIIHVLDTNGALLAFTGSGFEEIGRLPLVRELLINAQTGTYNSFIHPNGLYFTRNGTFIVNVNNQVGDNGTTIKENLPSGIWEFHRDTGFVHKQSFSYTPIGTTTVTDYGQNRISQAGALYEANLYSNSASGKPTIIAGANYYTDASTTASGIFVDDPLDTTQKYGYFTTAWLQSSAVKDTWQKLSLKYRQLLDSGDKIVVKYRTTESSPTEISITWVNTTSFTTTTNLLAYVGYEVEVLQGTGSGKCAHIVTVVNNAGTYTVTLDETFTGVTTGTAKARIQNWNKFLTISDQTSESLKTTLGKESMRIQFKVCMQFTGEDELHELAIINQPFETLT